MEAEAIALDWAIAACHQCDEVELICDREGLLGLMVKYLADVENKKLQKIWRGQQTTIGFYAI